MPNESVLSLGLFGRLSILEAPRPDVLERIKRVSQDKTRLGEVIEAENPQDVLLRVVPLLLIELNGLIESIVLSDGVIEFAGYDIKFVGDLNQRLFGVTPHLASWYYTQIWGDEANALRQRVLENLEMKPIWNTDPAQFEVETALSIPHDLQSFSIINRALSGEKLDIQFCRDLANAGEWSFEGDEAEKNGWEKLKNFVDRKLGPDWIAYRSAIGITETWPKGLTVNTLVPPFLSQEWLQWQFKYGLYTEFREALRSGTLSVSGYAIGNYYQFLAGAENVRMHLLKAVSQKYAEVLCTKFEEAGYFCVDMEMPPILRLCLRDSTTIRDVINRAIEWRGHSWFKRLRDHLAELTGEERPEKLIRYLNRLREHMEASIDGFGKGVTTGLAVSSAGSLSLSLPAIGKQLLSWRNPVVYVHSRVSKALGNRDSVGDLAHVLKLSRSEVLSLVRRVDLLRTASTKAST